MFTGLIEAVGTLARRQERPGRLWVNYPDHWPVPATGASIAVNGVCLTVAEHGRGEFAADLLAETATRTTLGRLPTGAPLNLERALTAERGFDGHIVTGHVDAVVTLRRWQEHAAGRELFVDIPAALADFIAPQGSVALNGISLTVAEVAGPVVRLGIIPHTYAQTNLRTLQSGAALNLEVDIIARYAVHALRRQRGGLAELLKPYDHS